MICPFCGVELPTLTPSTPPRLRYSMTETLRAHTMPHKRVLTRGLESPEDLGAGSWVLDPTRRVRVWQPA